MNNNQIIINKRNKLTSSKIELLESINVLSKNEIKTIHEIETKKTSYKDKINLKEIHEIKSENILEKKFEEVSSDVKSNKKIKKDKNEILKNDEQLRNIPAIVLTTSNNYRDVLECYKIGIAGYILKPLKYDDYLEQIKRMLQYWSINELVSQ